MIDRNEVRRLRLKADHLKLIGREFLHMPKNDVMALCNGIGPEWFPAKVRKFLDGLHPYFKATAAIHDMMWSCGYDFSRSNDIFYINGKWEVKAMYPWYNIRRYIGIWKAWKFSRLCQRYGYSAWQAAQRKLKR